MFFFSVKKDWIKKHEDQIVALTSQHAEETKVKEVYLLNNLIRNFKSLTNGFITNDRVLLFIYRLLLIYLKLKRRRKRNCSKRLRNWRRKIIRSWLLPNQVSRYTGRVIREKFTFWDTYIRTSVEVFRWGMTRTNMMIFCLVKLVNISFYISDNNVTNNGWMFWWFR